MKDRETIRSMMDSLMNTVQYTKNVFREFVTDGNIPVNIRWNLFLDAPQYLKSMDCCLCSFDSLPDDFCMYDDVYLDRFQTIDTIDFVGRLPNRFAEYVPALKEEILSKNLGSFTCDW